MTLAIGGIIFTLDLLAIIGFSTFHLATPRGIDAVVILGAKVGTPALEHRALTGLMYYQEGKTNTLVLSGGRGPGESTTEAQAMEAVIKKQITKTHSKMPHIILETRSTDTFQNLSYSKKLVPHAHTVVVVSDCYHLERAVATAKYAGFQKVYWNAPKPSYYANLDLAHYYVREAVAMIVYAPRFI